MINLTRLLSFLFFLWTLQPSVSLALVDAKKHVDAITVTGILFEQEGKIIYVSSVTHGLLRSQDGGGSWSHINRGVINPLIYEIEHPLTSKGVLYAASWGGGLYRSENGGDLWVEKNVGLTTTAVASLAIHPGNPKILFAATSQGVYRSDTQADRWYAWSEGLPRDNDFAYNTISLSTAQKTGPLVLLGTNRGIWQRGLSDSTWTFSGIQETDVRVLQVDPGTLSIFAGTSYGGLYQGKTGPVSGKVQWQEVNPLLRKSFIQSILVVNRAKKKIIYVGTSDHGVLRSGDGGRNWESRDKGIEQEEIKVLVADPKNSEHLLAGTRDSGVFQSHNEGNTWVPVPQPSPTLAQVIESSKKNAEASVKDRPPQLPPPAVFQRCNECHGWADPVLHLHPQTYWRVSPSRRNWQHTVERMARGGPWRDADKMAIREYMNRYYGEK